VTDARIPIRIQVENLPELEGELHRFTAPLTVEAIIRKMPLEGFIARWDTAVYIITDIARGVEKYTPRLAAGEIFYWSPERVVGIAVKNHISRPQTVKVGAVIGDYGVLSSARTGARMRFVLKTS
jgi:hypothetical protein